MMNETKATKTAAAKLRAIKRKATVYLLTKNEAEIRRGNTVIEWNGYRWIVDGVSVDLKATYQLGEDRKSFEDEDIFKIQFGIKY